MVLCTLIDLNFILFIQTLAAINGIDEFFQPSAFETYRPQKKRICARQNKLRMVQLNKLNIILQENLKIAQHNKLTKTQSSWQARMKNWQSLLRS